MEENNFWAKVEKTDNCWLWRGSITKFGYGQFRVGNKIKRAHRVSYELTKNLIPENLVIDHLCRNRACVNPNHLEPVTTKENVKRSVPFAQKNRKVKTHCNKGHEFTAETTSIIANQNNARRCKICHTQRQKQYRLAK